MTHDYKRNGTTTLFAALNVLDGKVIGQCQQRRTHADWLKFLRKIDPETPKDKTLHLIADNYATYKQPAVQDWLAKHPRFNTHFTPTSTWWLNMVERFFRDLTTERLCRGVFTSVPELVAAIDEYVAHHNTDPKPWCWDMTFLPTDVAGRWFFLYLILDVYSRKIVGFQVHEDDNSDHAARLVQRTALAEEIHAMPRDERPVLHGDNGATLKATTVLAMLWWLGAKPSYSRPRVSDDNALVESLFRTAKYRPEFPAAGFANLGAARDWAREFVHWYSRCCSRARTCRCTIRSRSMPSPICSTTGLVKR